MFQQLCVGVFALLFGLALLFAGYRFFLFLLPFWGFFAGFALGAATITQLLGDAFLGTVTGWVVGLIVGLIFAVLSYFIYFLGVAILAGSIGYALGSALVFLVFPDSSLVAFIVGLIMAIIVAGITLAFNLQKWAVILLTSVGGASTLIAAVLLFFGRVDVNDIVGDMVGPVLADSFIWLAVWIALVVSGVLVQAGLTRRYALAHPEGRRAF